MTERRAARVTSMTAMFLQLDATKFSLAVFSLKLKGFFERT